jgi:spore coat protein U-like protein
MLKKIVIAAVAVSALGSNAFAGTSTVLYNGPNLGVSADVVSSCAATAGTPVSFGTLKGPVSGATEATAGVINVTCDPGQEYAVGLGNGGYHNGTDRGIFGPGGAVPYVLYTDAARTIPFSNVALGDGTNATAPIGSVGGLGNGAVQTVNVYAKIPTGTARPTPGNYSDAVQINIAY